MMNTRDFLEQLHPHHDKALIFEYHNLRDQHLEPVPAGYHVTEIMQAHFDAMDCGGQASTWRQTIVQLMGPNRLDKPDFMSVEKFLSIYGRVSSNLKSITDDELRIEYGNSQQPVIHFHVQQLEVQANAVRVRLGLPGVTCKASDRKIAEASCCTLVSQVVGNVVWGDSNPMPEAARKSGCC